MNIQETDMMQITVFPNPGEGIFTLDYPLAWSDAVLKVCTMQGQCIYSRRLSDRQHEVLDLSKHTPGVYLMEVIASDKNVKQTFHRKVVIR